MKKRIVYALAILLALISLTKCKAGNEDLLVGNKILFDAIINKNNYGVWVTLKCDPKPNIIMTDGETPLHVALRNYNLRAIDFLIFFGADINATDSRNLTPLDYARIFKFSLGEESLKKAAKDKGISLLSKYGSLTPNKIRNSFLLNKKEIRDSITVFKEKDFYRVELSPIIITLADEELHYLKLGIEFVCKKEYADQAKKEKGKLFLEIRKFLMNYTIQKAKEDYIDRILHNEIQKCINQIFDRNEKNGVTKVFLSTFLLN